ncbi:MAG: hypothetical protein WB919_17565, partial [Candidatus Sulfotelmatobacter sp.]
MPRLLVAVILTLSASAFGQNNAEGAVQNDEQHNTVRKNADAIVQRSVEANKRDWEAAPGFDYCERDVGRTETKTYEDIMIFGSPYE